MFQVQKHPCATCIYRTDAPLNLAKIEADIADPHMDGFFLGYRVCHHSKDACCAGFWRKYHDAFALGQLAQRLDLVGHVTVDTLIERKRHGKRSGKRP